MKKAPLQINLDIACAIFPLLSPYPLGFLEKETMFFIDKFGLLTTRTLKNEQTIRKKYFYDKDTKWPVIVILKKEDHTPVVKGWILEEGEEKKLLSIFSTRHQARVFAKNNAGRIIRH